MRDTTLARKTSPFFLLTLILFASLTAVTGWGQQEDLTQLKTVAEASDFQDTSLSQQVIDFVDCCATVDHVTPLRFGTTVEGRPMVGVIVANPPYEFGNVDDPRLRVLLLGNIHSGECAGKEALLALLRELASDPHHPWLKDLVVIIAPNYNADANDRMGPNHRPGQVGPAGGMGVRENAMQLDLNRDFVKLETPEARALVGLINSFDPHLFIDCHTTNGSLHQYVLTYDVPHNPSSPQEVRDFLRKNMMPAVTKNLRENGIKTFYYGNFSRDNTVWETYGHEPRYSTEYVGLRGRLGILAEAYSYATFAERIAATDAFVRDCVNFVRDNADLVKKLLQDVRQQDVELAASTPEHQLIHLRSQMVPFDGKFIIEGIEDDQPHDFEVSFLGDFLPTTTVSLPWAYLIPADMSLEAERLRMHGIVVERLTTSTLVDASIYDINVINRSEFPFQGHFMVTVEASAHDETITVPADTFVVRTSQPLGRLAAYMLEPETNEGFVTWNFLDSRLAEGGQFPVIRLNRPVGLATIVADVVTASGKLELQDIFGPDQINLPTVSLDDVNWLPDGESYSIKKNGRLVGVDIKTGAESRMPQILDRGELAETFAEIDGVSRDDIREMQGMELQLRGPDQKLFVLGQGTRNFVFNRETGALVELGNVEQPAELVDLDPAGQRIAWVQGNNLMWMAETTMEPISITDDGRDEILNGKLDWVYQEELYGRGNFKAFWWSPDGNAIAWLRTDETPVQKYTVTDHQPVRGRLEVTAYPKAGDPLPLVGLHVYDLQSGNKVEFPLPQPESMPLGELLVSRVTWDGTDNTLLVQIQNRIQSWLDLYRFDPGAIQSNLLFRDQTAAWIESPGDPAILPDGSFLWLSPRSGFNSIWHYSADGQLIRQLTSQSWEVRELIGCDFQNGRVYFIATPDIPTRTVPMSISLDGRQVTRLSNDSGSHSVKFNDDYSSFIDLHSTAELPPSLALRSADGKLIRMLNPNTNDWLRHLDITPPEFVMLPVGQGANACELDAMLIKPPGFDPTRKYPVITHVYGGPQAPRVRDRFGGAQYLWHQYLARQGFIVFVVDNRSCSFQSARQAWPIYRNLAVHELDDITDAVRWLGSHPWVDADRIGIWGWSYGGYMTAYALTHSELFAAGIAGAPVTDWNNYDAIYTERYMDTPQANPDGYSMSSVLTAAANLHGALLLIHGTIDDNVHISNTFQLVKALQQAGQQFELMVYPGNRHSVRDPAQQLHLYHLMTDFFVKNLQ